jgi:hypothetical protein
MTPANNDACISISGELIIGDDVAIGPQLYMLDDNRHEISGSKPRKKQIAICNHVWIAARVTILPGVTIGDGCIIGAGCCHQGFSAADPLGGQSRQRHPRRRLEMKPGRRRTDTKDFRTWRSISGFAFSCIMISAGPKPM